MEKKKESIVLALIALIIGILALILSWIPIVNNFAAILAIIGFILALIALIVNRKNKKTISIVGFVISIVAFIIVLATQSFYSKTLDDAVNKTTSSKVTKTSGKINSKSDTETSDNKDTGKWDETTKTFTSTDAILKIDSVEKVADFEGKPVLKINWTLTNKQDKAETAQMLFLSLVKVQQKSTNTTNDLNYGILTEDGENHLQDNINPNGTVTGYYPYSLENETDPILISFTDGMFTEPVATYEISL